MAGIISSGDKSFPNFTNESLHTFYRLKLSAIENMMNSVPRPVLKAINVKPIDQIPMTNPEQDLRLKAIAQNIAYLHENISLAYKEENKKRE